MLAMLNVLAETAGADVTQATTEAAKNPILPTLNEMFWTLVFFGVLWALMKFVLLPPILRTFAAREEKIREDQRAAEEAESSSVERQQAYDASLQGARAEAVAILEAARSAGDAQRRELVGAAESEVAAMRSEAAADIASAKQRARDELTGSITDVAIDAASAVIESPVDRATTSRIVADYVSGNSGN